MKKTIWIATLIFILYLAAIIGIGYAIHLNGARFIIFTVVLGLVGAAATIAVVIYKRKALDGPPLDAAEQAEAANLEALVRSADTRLKASGGGKSIATLPVLYIIGDENAAKTQTILQSGLDAELIAGAVYRDGMVAPTQLANIWYTPQAIVIEASGALLRQPGLWRRMIRLTQPNKLGSALSKGALQPTRAAVFCVSIERVAANNSAESVRLLGKTMNERLRTLSQTLGISLPVYLLFTKLDTIPSFSDYAGNLTEEEVRQPIGALLARIGSGTGLYAESATSQAAARFDELCYSLSEFRLEILSRGGEPDKLARAYEFPRELRKMRAAIVDLLVEIGRPSQLAVNPFLRGFYFSGMRAHLVDDNMAAAAQPATPPPSADAGATRIFSFSGSQAATPAAAPASRGSRRVPQWVFLPHLFARVILADKSALETSRTSTKVNFVKRALIATAAACFLLYLIALTVSYSKNSALEANLRDAAAVPMRSVSHGDPASINDLDQLEKLRVIFAQVADYRKNGAPLSYRWGLYNADRVYAAACQAYGTHFRTLLLAPTQSNILTQLAALPATPLPTDDYGNTYRPLRAYLITTSNPDKSTTDLVPQALLAAWQQGRNFPTESTDLALAQFTTYAETLPEPNSCMAPLGGSPHSPEVNQARGYLSHFQGFNQVYASMKAAADRKVPGIRFNEKFPGSIRFVVDSYAVEGAFTKDGYAFMQNAIAHPEPYTSGEEWVLGPPTGTPIDIATLKTQLPAQYLADFLDAWRTFLKSAHVVAAGSFPEAKDHLHQLDSPGSNLLQLFQTISTNTAVPNPAYSQPFQAPQSIVAPNSVTLPVNTPYIQALQALEGSINSMLLIPNSQSDPTAVGPVIAAASNAEGSVGALRAGFTIPDPVGGMDTTSEKLLLAPIKSIEDIAKVAPAKAAGGGAQAFCGQIAPLLSKFPFNPDSPVDATADEVAKVFQPGQGALAQYAATLNKLITLQGNAYVPVQGGMVSINPAFLRFLNAAQVISTSLLPPTGNQPQVNFTLMQEPTPNLPPATLDIDGASLTTPGQTKNFTWNSSPTGNIKLSTTAGYANNAGGPWSLFRFAYGAKHPASNRLEFVFQMNGQPATSSTGVPLDYKYDVGGPGAQLLNPGFMRGALHCVSKVSQ
jgi:type VI secretion system protein ImpL